MEKVKKLISIELCKSYMAIYQKLEILQMLISKVIEFLERLYIDIEGLLPVTFSGFQYFLFIKNDARDMFFVLPIKTKKEIYNKLMDFWTWIENLADWKIKQICLEKKLKSNTFDS